jgi:hypothetical protein
MEEAKMLLVTQTKNGLYSSQSKISFAPDISGQNDGTFWNRISSTEV